MAFQVRDRTLEFDHLSTDLPLPTGLPSACNGARSFELDTGKVYEYAAPATKTGNGTWYDITAAVSGVAQSYDVVTTITRPANTTAYSNGDVLGGALDLGVLGLNAKRIEIQGLQLEADISAIPAGQTSWVLYLYSVTPPSALADNAAWDLPSGDRASFLGSIAFATMVDLGSTCYVEVSNINKALLLAGTHLFGYLVTVAGFTPAANSEVYKLTLHTKLTS